MKNVFTICCLIICFGFYANAQSTRVVLAEEFTQASCGPCASQNPNFNLLLNNNSTKVVAIKYQVNWPGVDPMNIQTQSLVGTRVSYYGTTSAPSAYMDGVAQTGGSYTGAPANWTQAKLDARAAITSPFDLAVTHNLSSDYDSIFVSVTITATGAASGALIAHVAVIERNIYFCEPPGSNGEDHFEGVMRDMFPNSSGTVLATSWTVGQTQTLTFAAPVKNYVYDKNNLAVVAFIQDNSTKNVHQAAYSGPQPMTMDAKLGCGNVGNPEFNCGTNWIPNITIQNTGTTNLTSANIDYTIDGVAGATIPWSGNIAPGATSSVTLPSVTSVPGLRNLTFTVSSPNGAQDLNTGQDMISASYYDYGTIGQNLPASQNFAATTFPPTPAWRNVNHNSGAGWLRNAAGLNGAGSARMYFWGSASGQIDELWMPNYDFSVSGATSAQIDLDLAYCQDGTSNDRMEIQYSVNCGQSWVTIFNEAGSVLAAGNPPSSTAWTPSSPSQWRHITASLNGAIGSPNVLIRFKATSAAGNNCYIDNISVNTNLTLSVPQILTNDNVNVFPNPTSGLFNVRLNLPKSEDVIVTVTNALGAVVRTMDLKSVSIMDLPVDLGNEAKGTYDVAVRTASGMITKRITLTN